MKIAILTLPLHVNYGGILQAYALQQVLENMGHEVEVLQKNSSYPFPKWKLPYILTKRTVKKLLLDSSTSIFFEKEMETISKNINDFISERINIRLIDSLSSIHPSDYDCIVVGSDQVWRKPYFTSMWKAPMKDAFLDFTKDWNIKRIAYAASFGLDNISEYTESDVKESKSAIKQFNQISVREDSGITICTDIFNVNAIQLLDPTMLLSQEDYKRIVEKRNLSPSPGKLFCYILDPNSRKTEIINEVANINKIEPFSLMVDVRDARIPLKERILPPIESFIKGFMDAEFIVTDSFHACVFSIIFNKPFIVIANHGRGLSRFTSLLKMFSLTDRIIDENSNILPPLEISTWNNINSILKEKQKEGIIFLKST